MWRRSAARHLACAALVAMGVGACGTNTTPADGPIGSSASAIINGEASPGSQDFVVQIVHPVAADEAYVCSGVLVAPNLVLTARHCVSSTPGAGFTCDSSGQGTDGGSIGADYAPSSLLVFSGTFSPETYSDPNAVGAQLFHDDGTNVCNHDVALVLLDRALTDVPIATLNLDAKPSVGALVTSVGWGIVADGASPTVRQERPGVTVLTVGPATDSQGYGIGSNEFAVGESICEGDSGGPALDATNAVIGVVSRGGNGVTATSSNLAATCIGASTVNFYSEAAAFRDLILGAFEAAHATPVLVGVPLGESCTGGSECTSGLCAMVDNDAGEVCTQRCASAPCPGGFRCAGDGGDALCVASPSGSGCAVASAVNVGSQKSPGYFVALLAAFTAALGSRWRSRRGRTRTCRSQQGTSRS